MSKHENLLQQWRDLRREKKRTNNAFAMVDLANRMRVLETKMTEKQVKHLREEYPGV